MNELTTAISPCSKCDDPPRKISRFYLGEAYCDRCYHRHFVPSVCTRCGRSSRILKGELPHECANCVLRQRWEGKSCARCNRLIQRYGAISDDGHPFCASCKAYAFPPKLCPNCNELKYQLGQDLRRGITEPVCAACRLKLGHTVCCAGCHRPRFIAGERDGKGYCANCLPTGSPPVVTCIDCAQQKYHFGSGRCEDCAWKRIHSRLLNQLYPEVPALWARDLMAEYYQTLRDQISYGTLSKSLRHDVALFAALPQHFQSADDLTGVMMIRKLGHQFLVHHGRAISFLNVKGYIATYEDPDYLLEWHLSRIRFYAAQGPTWSQAGLKRFLAHMLNRRDLSLDRNKRRTVPIKPKSLESAVRAAVKFLAFADAEGASCLSEVTQEHLDLFLGRYREYRLRIRAFLRYARRKERTFHKLIGPPSTKEFSLKKVIPEEARLALIDRFAESTNVADVRWSLVALFALIYAQPPHVTVTLPLSRVRIGEDGVYEVLFAKLWFPLDEATHALMERWLSMRRENSCFERDGESSFLFPGRQAGSHMRPETFTLWIANYQTTSRALVTTSLVKWASSDLDSPRILVDALGVSRVTATRYCKNLGMMLRPHVRHAVEGRL